MNLKYLATLGIKTGLLISIVATALFLIGCNLNAHYSWNIAPMTIRGLTGLVTLLILSIGIFIAMQNVKKLNQGFITYKLAIQTGIIVSLVSGITAALCSFIYCSYINPGYAAYIVSESKKTMLAQGEATMQITTDVTELQKQLSVTVQVMQSLVGQFVSGTVISLVMAFFIRTKK